MRRANEREPRAEILGRGVLAGYAVRRTEVRVGVNGDVPGIGGKPVLTVAVAYGRRAVPGR